MRLESIVHMHMRSVSMSDLQHAFKVCPNQCDYFEIARAGQKTQVENAVDNKPIIFTNEK